jgi:hypothetical protein
VGAAPIAFRTAAAVPDRVGAVASFHGGGLVTDAPNSPHLKAAKSKAEFLIAIAENDDARSPNEKTVLKETFAKANLPAEIEVYTGAAHGWCPPDSRVYNEPQAEKAWSRLLGCMEKLWSEDRRLGAFTAFVNLRPSLKPTTGGFRAIRNFRRMLADFPLPIRKPLPIAVAGPLCTASNRLSRVLAESDPNEHHVWE